MPGRQREAGIDGGQNHVTDCQVGDLREPQTGLQDEFDDGAVAGMIRRSGAEPPILRLGEHTGWSRLPLGR